MLASLYTLLRRMLHVVMTPVRLVREGQADLDGAYPDRVPPTAEQQMTQGMVTSSFVNPSGAGIF